KPSASEQWQNKTKGETSAVHLSLTRAGGSSKCSVRDAQRRMSKARVSVARAELISVCFLRHCQGSCRWPQNPILIECRDVDASVMRKTCRLVLKRVSSTSSWGLGFW